jgi:hypothetical protein
MPRKETNMQVKMSYRRMEDCGTNWRKKSFEKAGTDRDVSLLDNLHKSEKIKG